MKTKLKDEPIFLIATLCLFFPIGLIYLLCSEQSAKRRWLMGISGCIVFSSLLSLAFLNRPKKIEPADLQITITRETLSVGKSGGLVVTDGDRYCTAYTVTTSNDVLKVDKNLYTAAKPGSCTLTVSFGEEIRTAEIEVNDGPGTDSIVLASPSAERYHLITAGHAGKKAIEMTEEDALQSGKTPCKNCFN